MRLRLIRMAPVYGGFELTGKRKHALINADQDVLSRK